MLTGAPSGSTSMSSPFQSGSAPSIDPSAAAAGSTVAMPSQVAPSAAPSSTLTEPTPSGSITAAPRPIIPPEDVPTYGEIYYMVNLTCANIVCHVPLYFEPDLSDANNDQYDILMTRIVEQCGNLPLVKPFEPENSAILKVTKHECGDLAMPKGCTDPDCIGEEKRTALYNWIAAGAPRD